MLPAALQRIEATVADDALVLDVGGAAAPMPRADWVLDLQPHSARDAVRRERFDRRTWVQRDACDPEPWPFRDDEFAFAVCAGMLAQVRDPIRVCRELVRVARAGYVEIPTIEAELLASEEHAGVGDPRSRWLVEARGGELVFTAKVPGIHLDPTVRVPPRWGGTLAAEDRVLGLFWEDRLPARERHLLPGDEPALLAELRERITARFAPSAVERGARQARGLASSGLTVAGRPVRRAADSLLDRLR